MNIYTPLLQLKCNPQRNDLGSFEYEWMWRYIAYKFLYQIILASLKIYFMTLSPVPCPLPFRDLEIIICV